MGRGQPYPNIAIAPSVIPGTTASTAVNHYGLLRATEEMLGLPLLGTPPEPRPYAPSSASDTVLVALLLTTHMEKNWEPPP